MGKKMSNAPVCFTVAQIRINPVLGLDGCLKTIQEKMKTIGFSEYSLQMAPRLVPPGKDAASPYPSVQFYPRYVFDNSNRSSGFVIEHDSIAFQTTDYQTFDLFTEIFQAGITIVHDAVHFDAIQRIGLRYLDAVQPAPEEALSDYLIPEVLGLSNHYSGSPFKHSFSETVADIAVGRLVSRVAIKDGVLGLPADVAPMAQKIADRFLRATGRQAIVDTDAFSEKHEKFDAEQTSAILKTLHDEIDKVFKTLATAHAVAIWNKEM